MARYLALARVDFVAAIWLSVAVVAFMSALMNVGVSKRPGPALRMLPGLLFWCCLLPAPAAVPSYSLRHWQAEDGLPQSAVSSIVQTRDGYVWIGTYSGLARFDGVRFTVFDDNNTPEMRSSRITCLFEASDRTLWIGHEGGQVTLLRSNQFAAVAISLKWDTRKIYAIGSDESGDIWLLNEAGLLLRARDELALTPEPGLMSGVVNVARNGRGRFWVERNGAVSVLEGGGLRRLGFGGMPGDNGVQGICASADGGLWVVNNGIVRKWDGVKWSATLGPAPWLQSPTTALMETRAGALVAGTQDKGLFLLFPGGETLRFGSTNELRSDWVRSLCEDREGNLWVGTANGLVLLRAGSFSPVYPPDRWQARPVLSVTATPEGTLWVGTEGAGLYRLDQSGWSHFREEHGVGSPFVWSVAGDAQGRMWLGTWGGGIYVQNGQRFERAPGLEVTVPTPALLHDGEGALWVGTSAGLLKYSQGAMSWTGRADGAMPSEIRAVLRDGSGVIWLGTFGGGLGRLQNGDLKQFRKADGLSSEFVQCLHADADGALWIGTFGGGLNRLKHGRFSGVNTAHGLVNNFICWIEDDQLGNFWLSSHGGVMRVSKSELNQCADGILPSLSCISYGTADGLPTQECSGGFQPAGCRTPDGRLWFPTAKGLASVDPRNVHTNALPPPVVLEQFLVNDRPAGPRRPDSSTLEIAPGRHRFEFQFTGLSFVAPEKVKFKYRLAGLDDKWGEVTSSRSVIYSYIPPGQYHFEVLARNSDGVWSEAPARLEFRVLPYFWQTYWFRLLAGCALAVVGGSTVWLDARRRMKRNMERLERQRAVEHERARIAQDIHDDLGAHLTRITMLSETARGELDDPPKAGAHLQQIYHTARELTRSMDEIVWAVNPKHDTLEGLVFYLEKLTHDLVKLAGIRCRLDLPSQFPGWTLTSEVRHNLFLAFKEALHNVVKHSAAAEVRVSLALRPASFELCLEDNGRGFDPNAASALPAGDPDRIASRNGLTNMRRRLAEIGGACSVRSAPGQGTTVLFAVPVRGQ